MAIHVLPEQVVDQIAAGEVLERPAHLIKELIENSLDAGATEIEVEFDDGGRRVRIIDNGSGIAKADLPLAILRHATSKISVSEDLFALSSYGFRGEALASIAAVSRLKITSRQKDESNGHSLVSEFGRVESVSSQSTPIGTSLVVEGLFENVPARLRFLKSDTAETSQIKQVLRAIALSHPEVQFRVRNRSQLLYLWQPRDDWQARAEDVLAFKGFHLAEGCENEIWVRALVGSPDQTMQQNRGIWLFVQDRWIQDRSIVAAIMESYRNLLMHGEYPQVVLSLHVPKDFVDVNVHPTKSQVKFVDSQKVFRAILHTLRSGLEKAPWLKTSDQSKRVEIKPSFEMPRFEGEAFSSVQYAKKNFPLAQVRENIETYRTEPFSETFSSASSSVTSPGQPQTPEVGRTFWSQMEVLGQANLTYILAQSQDQFFLIDQHAAHERIVFERLMEQWKVGKFDTQAALLPLVLDLPAHELEALEAYFDQLSRLGLTLEKMSPEAIAVSSTPSFVSETAVVEVIKKLAYELAENGGSLAWEKRIGDIFASMACHSVVRAGQALSVEQMKNLLMQMDEFPLSSFCPHGRPVSVSWSFYDIERKFGRIL
jgi:DNA mismatch repair protein MutL